MKYFCKQLGIEYDSKEAMFKGLRENSEQIIEAKKAVIYNAREGEGKGAVSLIPVVKSNREQIKGITFDENYHYIVANSTNILDSHEDLHLKGIWNKSVKEQQGKVYLVEDHKLSASNVIVRKEHIEMSIEEVPFSLLNKPYTSNTEVLVYKFRKDKVINKIYSEWLESGDEIQASVRMLYVKMVFCMNSEDKLDVEYKKNYDKYISEIANKDDFEEIDYFWAILEAKNVLESSLVLFGSNPVTGAIEEKIEPLISTHKNDNEPSDDTHKEFYLNLLKTT